MSNSALASLTAQYTDSENEDEQQQSPDSQNSQSSAIIPPPKHTPQQTPEKTKKESPPKKKKKSKDSVKRLVSYQDDTIVSDDEKYEDDEGEDDPALVSSESEDERDDKIEEGQTPQRNGGSPIEIDDDSGGDGKSSKNPKDKYARFSHYGFSLPPEPKGKPLPELTEKINQLYEKMETNNMDMNRIIQQRKEFRNPSIYEKLIQFCDINEFGTNYPPEIYDPLQWGTESYYEELALVQKNEMLKRQKEKKDSGKIEQVSALARKVEEEAKKRKSKWDQPATGAKPTVPPLTTTVTGTKGTVISAFGSLPKKPAP
ncbi:SAP30-binding protein [Haematobia irritans]|uniref:SAP30-binding protein n=1 Tax=Haematobia irritans TaxID=7368 RepID=UPI003F501182